MKTSLFSTDRVLLTTIYYQKGENPYSFEDLKDTSDLAKPRKKSPWSSGA